MPVATLDDPGNDDGPPSVVPLFGASPTALLFVRDSGSSPGAWIAPFDGWGAWPPPDLITANVTLVPFWQVENGQTTISVLATSTSPPPVGGFSIAMGYGGVGDPPATDITLQIYGQMHAEVGLPGLPVMLEVEGDEFAALAATSTAATGGYALALAISKIGTGWSKLLAGCASTSPTADAAAMAGGWILAAALGTPLTLSDPLPYFDTTCPPMSISPATNLQLATLDFWGNPGPAGASIPAGSPVTGLRMAPRSTGAWLFWTETGGQGVRGAMVDTSAQPSATYAPLPQANVDGAFDAQPFEDTVVLAGVSRTSGEDDTVVVKALGSATQMLWETTIPTGGQVDGPPRVLIGSGGGAVLVAWSELAAGASSHRLRVARIDCP
jgi:hypothetical protein